MIVATGNKAWARSLALRDLLQHSALIELEVPGTIASSDSRAGRRSFSDAIVGSPFARPGTESAVGGMAWDPDAPAPSGAAALGSQSPGS